MSSCPEWISVSHLRKLESYLARYDIERIYRAVVMITIKRIRANFTAVRSENLKSKKMYRNNEIKN